MNGVRTDNLVVIGTDCTHLPFDHNHDGTKSINEMKVQTVIS